MYGAEINKSKQAASSSTKSPAAARPVFPPPAVDLADPDFDVTGNDDGRGHRRRNAAMIFCAERTGPAFAAVQALEMAS